MTEDLFELFDEIAYKQEKLDEITAALGADANYQFLEKALEKTEKAIVKSLGGNEGHHKHVSSTDLFYDYVKNRDAATKTELLDYIKLTIENDWTEEVGMTIIRG